MTIEISFIESFKGVQLLGIIISGFLLARTIINFKREKLTRGTFIIWASIWSFATIIFSYPGISHQFFEALNSQNTVLIAVVFANVLLFVLVFLMYEKNNKTDQQIKKLIQQLAIKSNLLEDFDTDSKKRK